MTLLKDSLAPIISEPFVGVLLHLQIINVVICSYQRCDTEVMRPALTKNYLYLCFTQCTYYVPEISILWISLSLGYKVMINKYYLSHLHSSQYPETNLKWIVAIAIPVLRPSKIFSLWYANTTCMPWIGKVRFHLVAGMVSGGTKSKSYYFISHKFQLNIQRT